MPIVSLVRARDYDPDAVLEAVRRALAPLGGMAAFAGPGQKTLLKPNLVMGKPPESAAVTHWTVVRAAAILAREAGAAPVTMGDSPGHGDALRAAEIAGYLRVSRELDVPWVFFEPMTVRRPGRPFPSLELAREAMEADAVINLPKLKTHGQLRLTLAMKNLFGAVPGYRKLEWHYRAGHDAARFARMLYEIYRAVNPRLHLVDAIVSMDGLGPTGGRPNPTGFLAAGADGVAVDTVLAELVGVDPADVPLLAAAREAGDGEPGPVELAGDPPSALRPARFEAPRLRSPRMHGDWVERHMPWLARWLRNQLSAMPFPKPECVGCGECVRLCPAGVIGWRPGGRPEIDRGRCLRCYCCHELCPRQAMGLRRPGWLGRMLVKR